MKNGCERGAEWLKVETNVKMVIKPVEKSEEHKTKLNKKNSEDKKRRDLKKKKTYGRDEEGKKLTKETISNRKSTS